MTAAELLKALRGHGAELQAAGDRLLCRAAGAGLPPYLKTLVPWHRKQLLALLAAEKGIPPGARLFFQADGAKVCWPEQAHLWTWAGAPGWVYAKDRPPPACVPVLAPSSRRKCPSCSGRNLRVQWQTCKNDEKRLQAKCNGCEAHVGYLKLSPDNPEVQWRLA